jgi:hypothetical protein
MHDTATKRSTGTQLMGLFKLLRPKQWIKNGFVLAPLVFTGEFMREASLKQALLAALLFCVASSATYIVNDVKDIESDRRHPTKSRNRPLAFMWARASPFSPPPSRHVPWTSATRVLPSARQLKRGVLESCEFTQRGFLESRRTRHTPRRTQDSESRQWTRLDTLSRRATCACGQRAACTAAPTHPRLWYVGAYAACTATTADPCADLRLSFCLRAGGSAGSFQLSIVGRDSGPRGFCDRPPSIRNRR